MSAARHLPQNPPVTYVAYPSFLHPQSHPERLATLATLHGLSPAPPERCRVLELGCNDGTNLLPAALTFPESVFVGIDLDEDAVVRGVARARALGVDNLELRKADLLDEPLDGPPFDYVVAHGFYSWVPKPVRDQALAFCRGRLAPHGVAYFSYNSYPGGHIRGMIREMLLFHVGGIDDPAARVAQSKALLKFISSSPNAPDSYRALLEAELVQMAQYDDGAILFDELAPYNDPVLFSDFAKHAAGYGLQFLSEANFYEMRLSRFEPEVQETLRQLGEDVVRREQYLDFLTCRRFRQTLLCREGLTLDRAVSPRILTKLHLYSTAKAVTEEPDLAGPSMVEFEGARDAGVTTDHPLTKAALSVLGSIFPARLTFEELVEAAHARLGSAKPPAREDVGYLLNLLFAALEAGLLEVSVVPSGVTLAPALTRIAALAEPNAGPAA